MYNIYLDNSATTRVDERVIEIMTQVMRADFGNPSSKHMMGVESERYLRTARETLAGIMKVNESEILFTSGGTESNNMALIGTAMAARRNGRHIITTAIEHPSVLEPLKYLEGEGFDITYLSVDSEGHISLDELKSAIRPDTILVSVMFVNNEIGAVQDIEGIGRLIKSVNPQTLFHVDAIQAFGKFRIYPNRMNIDLLSVSGHKFHGPKGIGFLYIRKGTKIRPLILGGGQQKGMRSGTDNVPGVAGLAEAARIAYDGLDGFVSDMYGMRDQLNQGLEELRCELMAGGVNIRLKINSSTGAFSGQPFTDGAPHIVSCTFAPVKSEVLLHALEDKGIYVSSGSACSSNKPGLSGTLQAIGLSPKEADCTLRFSLSRFNTSEQIDGTIEVLRELLPVLSRFTAR